MPRSFRSPEQVLRDTQQDLYFIQFDASFDDEPPIPGKDELLAWFQRELPDVAWEDLGPFEELGYLSGGCGVLVRVGLDEATAKHFAAAWENEDGSSKDPRWVCYLYTYQQFLESGREQAPDYSNL